MRRKQQIRIPYKLEISGQLIFLVETRNPKLTNILEYSDHEVLRRKIVNKHVHSAGPWIVSIRDVLIGEMLEIYRREFARSLEWTSSATYTPIMLKESGILYILPTKKEINKQLKTRKWKWVSDEFGERWIETKRKRCHISCFSKLSKAVFIKIKKIDITNNGKNNVF